MVNWGVPATVSHGPNIRGSGLQFFIHLYISTLVDLNSESFQTDVSGIWSPAGGDQKIRTL